MPRIDVWTDERSGRKFRITKLPAQDGVYQWTVERDTPVHEPLGAVYREGRKIWAVTSTLADGKAERIPVDSVEDGWKLITDGA